MLNKPAIFLLFLIASAFMASDADTSAKEYASRDWQRIRDEGIVAMQHEDYATAETIFKKALILARSFGKTDVALTTSLNDLGQVYARSGKFEQARPFYVEVLKLDESRYGRQSPALIKPLNNIVRVSCASGKCYDTIPQLKRLLSIRRSAEPEHRQEIPVNLLLIGEAYEKKRNYAAALDYFEQAVAAEKQISGGKSAMVKALSRNVDRVRLSTAHLLNGK